MIQISCFLEGRIENSRTCPAEAENAAKSSITTITYQPCFSSLKVFTASPRIRSKMTQSISVQDIPALLSPKLPAQSVETENEEEQAPVLLPPELLVVIMDCLSSTKSPKSLLEFMLSSRATFDLGIPCLFRQVKLTWSTMDSVVLSVERWAAHRHIRTLAIDDTSDDWKWSCEKFDRFLEACVKYVERLEVASHMDVLFAILQSLSRAAESSATNGALNLQTLDLTVLFSSERDLRYYLERLQFDENLKYPSSISHVDLNLSWSDVDRTLF